MTTFDTVGKKHPLSPGELFRLFFKPSEFFASSRWLDRTTIIFPLILITGIAAAITRIAKKVIKAELANQPLKWEHLLTDWTLYWAVVIGLGVILAVIVWFVGGWWYKARLQWSGASNVISQDARRTYVYQDLVISGPLILLTIAQTFLYTNYRQAWQNGEGLGMVAIVFSFWSCWTSYVAATTAFPVDKKKARFWFLGLPIVGYVFSLGLVGWMYSEI